VGRFRLFKCGEKYYSEAPGFGNSIAFPKVSVEFFRRGGNDAGYASLPACSNGRKTRWRLAARLEPDARDCKQ
jgi:hypothetical protein